MFSARFSRTSHEPSPLWEAKAALESGGGRILDLTLGNPTAAGIAYPPGLPASLGRPSILRYHPDPRGHLEARTAISGYYRNLRTADGKERVIHPEDLILTSSTSEAYSFLFKLLCDPGDEVLIPTPTYPLFHSLAELDHVRLLRYPLRPDPPRSAGALAGTSHAAGAIPASAASARWSPDFTFLRNLVSTRTKALILVSPNNPTGHIAGPREIAGYLEVAREYGLALIVDEVFSEYLLGGDASAYHPVLSQGPLVFTLNGLSKLAGLPQLKLGWIHAGGEPSLVRRALEHLEWIADAYLSVNTPVQTACADILAQAPGIRASIQNRLEANLAAAQELSKPAASGRTASPGRMGVQMLRPEAGWSLVVAVDLADGSPSLDDEAFAMGLLRRHGVYVHPGHLFGFEEGEGRFHLVLSLLTPEADFREGFRLLLDLAGGQAHAG